MSENKQKSITLIGVNFYPEDTAIGLYSTQMMQHLAENGFEINVITGFPYYPQWRIWESYANRAKYCEEEIENMRVLRYKQYVPATPSFLKRIWHLIDFSWGSFWNLRKIKQTDLILCIVPFTSTIFLGWLFKKRLGAKLWVHIQDFEFDAALQAGVSENTGGMKKLIFKGLFGIEKKLLNQADRASTISYSMIRKLESKTTSPSYFFPNWIDAEKINPENAQPHAHLDKSKFSILYSGNVGDKQDWELFLELLPELEGNDNVEIVVVGGGAKYDWLQKQASPYRFVRFFKPVPYEELSDLLCSANLHILFQKTEVIDTVMPSKLLGMMASGVPSLVTGNAQSEVRSVLETSQGGYYLDSPNISEMVRIIETYIGNSQKASSTGKAAREFIISKFNKPAILGALVSEIKQLTDRPS